MKKLALAVVSCVCSTLVFGGTQYVENITFGIDTFQYYNSSQFSISKDSSSGSGCVIQPHGSGYTYNIVDFTINFSPVDYLSDNSSGGVCSGTFDGGATFSINGDLVLLDEFENVVATYADDALLLSADMDPAATTWNLTETTSYSNTLATEGDLDFIPTAGALYDGVTVNGGDTLYIGDIDFRLGLYTPSGFAFKYTGTPITTGLNNFDEIMFASSVAPTIQMTSQIPEPATLMLLGLGGLLIRRKK